MTQTYEAWRITYQSSEQAARAAFERMMQLEQGKCLHQIAEPVEYPHLPQSVADVVDFMGGGKVDVDFSQPAPTGGTSLYTADQMRAYVDADRTQRAAAPQAVQPAIMPKGESAAAQLRAMATNYPAGHNWDKLDARACIRGALEIEALRALLAAAPAHPAEGVQAQDMVSVKKEDANAFCRILTALGMEEEGDPVAEVQRLLAATQPAAQPVATITGLDEFGPLLGWHEHWAKFPVGTNFYTQPAAQGLDSAISEAVLEAVKAINRGNGDGRAYRAALGWIVAHLNQAVARSLAVDPSGKDALPIATAIAAQAKQGGA